MRIREVGSARDIKIKSLTVRFHREGEPIQQADVIKKMLDLGLTEQEVGKKLGLRQDKVSRLKRLLNLTPAIIRALKRGELARTTGYEISKLSRDDQLKFEKQLEEGITVYDVASFRKNQSISDKLLDAIDGSPNLSDFEDINIVVCPKCGFKIERSGKQSGTHG